MLSVLKEIVIWDLQQVWFVMVGLPLGLLFILIGLYETVFHGKTKRAKLKKQRMALAAWDELHDGQTERLDDPRGYPPPVVRGRQQVRELAEELEDEYYDLGEEFYEEDEYYDPLPPSRQSAPAPRYPTRPMPVGQSRRPVRPQPQSASRPSRRPVDPPRQRVKRPSRPVAQREEYPPRQRVKRLPKMQHGGK